MLLPIDVSNSFTKTMFSLIDMLKFISIVIPMQPVIYM